MTDIVDRLMQARVAKHGKGPLKLPSIPCLYEEAASEITRLRSERDEALRLHDVAFSDASKLDSENVGLRSSNRLLTEVAEAARILREKQRDYMAHRGDEARGRAVAVASEAVDEALAALAPVSEGD